MGETNKEVEGHLVRAFIEKEEERERRSKARPPQTWANTWGDEGRWRGRKGGAMAIGFVAFNAY